MEALLACRFLVLEECKSLFPPPLISTRPPFHPRHVVPSYLVERRRGRERLGEGRTGTHSTTIATSPVVALSAGHRKHSSLGLDKAAAPSEPQVHRASRLRHLCQPASSLRRKKGSRRREEGGGRGRETLTDALGCSSSVRQDSGEAWPRSCSCQRWFW